MAFSRYCTLGIRISQTDAPGTVTAENFKMCNAQQWPSLLVGSSLALSSELVKIVTNSL